MHLLGVNEDSVVLGAFFVVEILMGWIHKRVNTLRKRKNEMNQVESSRT